MSQQDEFNRRSIQEIEVDINNLYREEVYTDLQVASIRRLVPVRPDGSVDTSRTMLFSGMTQIMTPQGALPLQVAIEAATLEEAFKKFPAAVQRGVDEMMQELREMQRREASRIVVPGADTGPKLFGV